MEDAATSMEEVKRGYGRYLARKIAFIAICIFAVIVIAGVSCTLGDREIGFLRVYGII